MRDAHGDHLLTPYEISRIVGGVFASLIPQSEPGAVVEALDIFVLDRDLFAEAWTNLEAQMDQVRSMSERIVKPTRHDA